MLIPISEQVFVPLARVERISFFGDGAIVKYLDDRQVDRLDAVDAARLKEFLELNHKVVVGG
jgi:hypothetical protein